MKLQRNRFLFVMIAALLAILTFLLTGNASPASARTGLTETGAVASARSQAASPSGPAAPAASDDVFVALSNGLSLGNATRWSEYLCVGEEVCKVGDVNGDGRDDAVVFVRDNSQNLANDVWVSLSNGSGFAAPRLWSDYFCVLDETCAVGDVNGDGRDDVIAFVKSTNGENDSDVWVGLSTGSGFGPPLKWHDFFCTGSEVCGVGDVNGDGRDDVIAFVRTTMDDKNGDVWVGLSTGTSFGAPSKWSDFFCIGSETCAVADVNGDGRDDLLVFVGSSNTANDSDVWVSLSTGTGFGPNLKWSDYFCTGRETCAVGDVNGDGRDDVLVFVGSSNNPNDSDVWVALSTGSGFGPTQKWHDFFCTRREVCSVGDFDGDNRADVVAFVRAQDNANTVRTISLSISLYRAANTPAERAPYEEIIEFFADAVYEMSNGRHRVGSVTFWPNGRFSANADVVWTANVWPSSSTPGAGWAGENLRMGDVFPFPTPYNALQSGMTLGAGYTLAHEWGHYYYGLFDEYSGTAPCNTRGMTENQTCDQTVANSVMGSQWNATGGDFNWLNFSTALNQNSQNANWRAYRASGWEVLARSPDNDPKDGWRANLRRRTYYPELTGAAPASGVAPSIELPDSAARSSLAIFWMPATAQGPSGADAGDYQPTVYSLTGPAILYPEAARVVATLSRDNVLIARADVDGTVTNPDGTTTELAFRDDGLAPDAVADDGLYTTIMPYTQVGLHEVAVNFGNDSGLAETTYKHYHFAPGPDGETYDPQPEPVGEQFRQETATEIMVSGFDPELMWQLIPTLLTVDNHDYPGRIDMPGDRDTFIFTAEQTGVLIFRVTQLLDGMQPHVRIFQGEPAELVGAYTFTATSDQYFFTRLEVQAGERFLIEVEHVNAQANQGLFNVSIGPPLLNSFETAGGWRTYLPAVIR